MAINSVLMISVPSLLSVVVVCWTHSISLVNVGSDESALIVIGDASNW